MENQEQNVLAAKVSDFKEIVSSFSQLLQAENEALEKFDLAKVSELYEQKSKTVTAYRNMVAYFIKNQESLKALPEADRNTLRDISQQLDELIRKNDILLKTKMQTNKMVMDSIVNIAKVTNNANSTSYGSQGKYSPLDNNSNALTVNRTL
jgi:hypothetical protein